METDVLQDLLAASRNLQDLIRSLVDENRILRRQLKTQAGGNRPKLGPEDRRMIRDMHRAGISMRQIATSFDVNHSTISRLVRGHHYK